MLISPLIRGPSFRIQDFNHGETFAMQQSDWRILPEVLGPAGNCDHLLVSYDSHHQFPKLIVLLDTAFALTAPRN